MGDYARTAEPQTDNYCHNTESASFQSGTCVVYQELHGHTCGGLLDGLHSLGSRAAGHKRCKEVYDRPLTMYNEIVRGTVLNLNTTPLALATKGGNCLLFSSPGAVCRSQESYIYAEG